MTPHEFCSRWTERLKPGDRDQFLLELAMLLTEEQARERARLLGTVRKLDDTVNRGVDQDDAKEAALRA